MITQIIQNKKQFIYVEVDAGKKKKNNWHLESFDNHIDCRYTHNRSVYRSNHYYYLI